MFRENELDFERQLDRYRMWLTGEPANDRYWYHQAQDMQALIVAEALRDLMAAAVMYSSRVQDGEPLAHLRYGVGRRSKTLWLSIRNLTRLVPPDREAPMPQEEVDEAARDLNVIYINIRGLMDNLAWAIVHQFGSAKTRALKPASVGLFRRTIANDEALSPLATALDPFKQWDSEMAERRDPAAHRIPLSVPPTVLDKASQQEWLERRADYDAAMERALEIVRDRNANSDEAFQRVHEASARMEAVGRFMPWFHHHYDDGQYPIYPTVPQDLAMMLKVSARVFEFMDQHLVQNSISPQF